MEAGAGETVPSGVVEMQTGLSFLHGSISPNCATSSKFLYLSEPQLLPSVRWTWWQHTAEIRVADNVYKNHTIAALS